MPDPPPSFGGLPRPPPPPPRKPIFPPPSVSVQGRFSSTAVGLCHDCEWVFKWVLNDVPLANGCHVVVDFEVKINHFFWQVQELEGPSSVLVTSLE